MQPPKNFVELAITVAGCSPSRLSCAKSHRGVVIWRDGVILGTGRNAPPVPFRCTADDACRKVCNKVAVHAEERAIIRARCSVRGAELLHVKVDRELGDIVASGPPSCWQCSRMILEAGIGRVWLFGDDGWRSWTGEEFHKATLEHHEFPIIVHKPAGS